jgi:ABC-type Mn2+/Zn2+ transport system permease subunit
MFTKAPDLVALALSVSMSVAAGLVGCFAVMRRMTLAADAMSHVALPGIGLALLLHGSPVAGAMVMLLLGAALIWAVERRTRMSTEVIVGVAFSVALAAGSTITSGEELIDALFGNSGPASRVEAGLGALATLLVIGYILRARSALVVALVSPEIAMTSGVNVARTELYFLFAFALTIGLGLRYLGVLLMGSLIIIPAAVARRFARSLSAMFLWSVAIAVLATVCGSAIAALAGRQSGPFIVMIAGGVFFLSLLRPRSA